MKTLPPSNIIRGIGHDGEIVLQLFLREQSALFVPRVLVTARVRRQGIRDDLVHGLRVVHVTRQLGDQFGQVGRRVGGMRVHERAQHQQRVVARANGLVV